MVAPVVAGLVIASVGYGIYRSVRGGLENKRFWDDYKRKTGITPKYPIRSGYSYDYGRALSGASFGAGYVLGNQYGYRPRGTNNYDPMYR